MGGAAFATSSRARSRTRHQRGQRLGLHGPEEMCSPPLVARTFSLDANGDAILPCLRSCGHRSLGRERPTGRHVVASWGVEL